MSLLDRTVLASLAVVAGMAMAAASSEPPRDSLFQQRIGEAVGSIVRQDDDALARFETLRGLGEGRRDELLVQIALYLETASGTEQTMAGALIVRQLGFTPEEKLDAVLPHLESAGTTLRRVFTELLSTIDRPEGGDPDFRIYEERIRRDKDAPPAALILYMYEVSPDGALASMERLHGGAVRHEPLSRTTQSIGEMARDAAWWRRLYAAAVLRERPDLATAETLSRLKTDPHPLVRRAASAG